VSQKLGSCVMKHLTQYAQHHRKIVLYSDSCTGQNRSIRMFLILPVIVYDPYMSTETSHHNFLVSGHSYLPNDSGFAIIE
jgi:hypothetical protein